MRTRKGDNRLLENERNAQKSLTTNHNQPLSQDFYLISTGHLIATAPFALSGGKNDTPSNQLSINKKIQNIHKHKIQMKFYISALITDQSYSTKGT